jgi:replicative DNA helicase
MKLENLILKNLIKNEKFCRATLPYIKAEYFSDKVEKAIFRTIYKFVDTYNDQPTVESIRVILSESNWLAQEDVDVAVTQLESISEEEQSNYDWLIDKTESFCKEKAIHNAVLESIGIIADDKSNKKDRKDKGVIPELLKEALSISFDPTVGHDYDVDAEARYEFYHRKEEKIPFDIELMNVITTGGFPKKTLNVIMAGTNTGKSLAMCHFATNNIICGKNVLYITMEMAEERIAERIDANLLDVSLDNLKMVSKAQYMNLIDKSKERAAGKLIIKEYPTSSANVNHFRHLLNELELKKNFVPDIIYIDYLNICSSSRVKMSNTVNSYILIKSIAEEIRGLAVEFNVPIVTATQTNRTGFSNSDVDLTNTSESFGLPATADFMFALINTEELEKLSQLMVKQLKNRYGDVSKNKKFAIGVDRSKMRLYDIGSAALDIDTHEQESEDEFSEYSGKTYLKEKFSSFKY